MSSSELELFAEKDGENIDKGEDEFKNLLEEFIDVEEQVNDQKNIIENLKPCYCSD